MPKRFLLIRPDAMGDFISIIPVIKTLRKAEPDSIITVLGSRANQAVAAYVSELSMFINADDYHHQYRKLLLHIRQHHFDVVLVFNHAPKWCWLGVLANIPIRIGDKYRLNTRLLFNRGVYINNADHSAHVVDYNLMYLKCLGYDDAVCSVSLTTGNTIYEKATLPQEYIVFHLGHLGGSAGRLWSSRAYADIINLIHQQIGLSVVLTGQNSFDAFSKEVIAGVDDKSKVLSLVEKTTLPELIAVLKAAAAYIGTDTGVTHLAAACGTDSVFVMGIKAIKPIRWYPYATRHVTVRTEVRCPYICHFSTCTHDDCLEALSSQKIVNGVERLLKKQPLTDNDFEQSMSVLLPYDAATAEAMKLVSSRLVASGFRVIDCNRFNIFHLSFLWKLCQTEDITIIHTFSKVTTQLAKFLSPLLATILFVQPLVVYTSPKNETLLIDQDWASFYKHCFESLSVKSNKRYWKQSL